MLLAPFGTTAWATSRPDLVVTGVTDPPATARAGDSFTLTSTVLNQGTLDAIATVTKFYLVVGTSKKNLKGVQPIAPLGVGASDGGAIAVSVYSDTNPGVYTLQACADGDGDVTESVESNNCFTAASGITIIESPDLVITSVGNPPSSASQGQSIVAKSTAKNVGAVDADPTVTKYYVVSNADGQRYDLKDGDMPVPLLKAGSSTTGQINAIIRTNTPPGSYKLQACADSDRTAPEVNEQNNCFLSSGNVTVTAVPDLTITSVSVAGLPATVTPGASLAVTVVVKNGGLADAKASTMKYVLVNTVSASEKNLNGTATIPIVPAGGSVTVQKTVTLYSDTVSGTYNVQACADSGKVVAEAIESNNCGLAGGVVTVQGVTVSHSDLVVTAVTPPPATLLPGQSFSVGATVKNQGTDPASPSTTSFYITNQSTQVRKNLKGGQDVPALDPNVSATPAAATISVYSDTVPGTYRMQACADGPRTVAEQVETNNCFDATGTLVVSAVPNLVVSALGNPPSQAAQGSTFKLSTSVRNTGSIGAAASNAKYYLVSTLDGTRFDLKGKLSVPALGAGATFSESFAVEVRSDPTDLTPPGTYKAQACADGDKVVFETSEDDNCFTSSGIVTVVTPPDLTVTAVTAPNKVITVARGGGFTAGATVKNVGQGDAAASTLKFLLVNTLDGSVKNLNGTLSYSLLRGGSTSTLQRTVTIFLDTPLGTYNVQACADSLDVVKEISETNNCTTNSFVLTVQ